MSDNVVRLPVITRLDIDADQLLRETIGKLDGFVLTGWDKDGDEYFLSSIADGGTALWLLERCKAALIESGGHK